MAKKPSIYPVGDFNADYQEALVASGLVDDVVDTSDLAPHPFRYAEGEYICRHGDPAECLWIIVNGSVAVRQAGHTLSVRRRNEVVGEQHLVGNGYRRIYDLVAVENTVEVLSIDKARIEQHPEAAVIWRNIARIVSTKLRSATKKTASLGRQLADDTRILHAYTNEYALQRRLQAGGMQQAEYQVDRAIIWFSDVVDFSQYTLSMAPDRVADIVQRFFNAQSLPIISRGGHIDKFMGDGMMAFWVLQPTATDARHECLEALRAAEEAAAAVAQIRVGNTPLALRIGLHLGMVVSGDFGSVARHQFTLIGTEVNKAARLEQIHVSDLIDGPADIGSIRLSREFHSELSAPVQKKYALRTVARAKNMEALEFYSAPPDAALRS